MASALKTEQWQENEQKRNWLELPYDITANILHRVNILDILENVEEVCTSWRKICKDPSMWRVIDSDKISLQIRNRWKVKMCKHAVDRSQGQLVEISIVDFNDYELLLYISHRSSQLKRLKIAHCFWFIYDSLADTLKNFPLLEELSLYKTYISKEAIETAGRCCPLLKTLKVNKQASIVWNANMDEKSLIQNDIAVAISENLCELRHLELIGDNLSNIGLKAILDNCTHLESLDLRQCFRVNLEGDMGK